MTNKHNFKELTIKDIVKLNNRGIDKFVYLLVKNEEVIYVGKSDGRVLSRISSHLKTKKFDKVLYVAVKSKDKLDKKEIELISVYKPKLNTIGVKTLTKDNKHYKEIVLIAKRNLKTKMKVKKIIELDKDISSDSIAKLIDKTVRTVQRHRKSVVKSL